MFNCVTVQLSYERLHHAMVIDMPDGLSVQPPPPPGKLAVQFIFLFMMEMMIEFAYSEADFKQTSGEEVKMSLKQNQLGAYQIIKNGSKGIWMEGYPAKYPSVV